MTENQKVAVLANLEARALAAERAGLRSTAKSWRDFAASVKVRPAAEIVLAREIEAPIE